MLPHLSRIRELLIVVVVLVDARSCKAFSRSTIFSENHHRTAATTRLQLSKQDATTVSCKVSRILPQTSPAEAEQAWLEHQWVKGGGLPIVIVDQTPADDDDANNSANCRERLILPIGMKERLLDSNDNDTDSRSIHYTVSDPGFVLRQHLVPNSHKAVVTFEPVLANAAVGGGGGCRMKWRVEFQANQLRSFYQTLTDFTISTAATTVQEAVAQPRRLTLTTTLSVNDPNVACREWIEFLWGRAGGGLFVPPGIATGNAIEGMPDSSRARETLLRIPPYLRETITRVSWSSSDNDGAVVCYDVESPGWLTVPFLVHTHTARVQFTRKPNTNNEIQMVWNIEIRPYAMASRLVEPLVVMTVSTILRNFKVHLEEPDAYVPLGLPRGYGGRRLDSVVRKETWLGGILDAHLSDRRSTLQQTLSLFQPWTWGRTGLGDAEDDVQYSWSDGAIDQQ